MANISRLYCRKFANWKDPLRQVNVVDNDPTVDPAVPKGCKALEFLFPGAPDKDLLMQLQFRFRFPQGARVWQEAPQFMRDLFGRLDQGNSKKTKNGVLLPLKPFGQQIGRAVRLSAKSKNKMRLIVQIPDKFKEQAWEVSVAQVWEELELGRVTWQLLSKKQIAERRKLLKIK